MDCLYFCDLQFLSNDLESVYFSVLPFINHLQKHRLIKIEHLVFIFTQISRLDCELETVRQSVGTAAPSKPLLPEEMSPSSVQIINSLNEYMIQLLQVNLLVISLS